MLRLVCGLFVELTVLVDGSCFVSFTVSILNCFTLVAVTLLWLQLLVLAGLGMGGVPVLEPGMG